MRLHGWQGQNIVTRPAAVLSALRATVAARSATEELARPMHYLETQVAHMQYPQCVTDGWPIGSGMVESATTLVVEDRLTGAGRHWADANVNPLLARRNAIGNDRWEACWMVIKREWRQAVVATRLQQRAKCHVVCPPAAQAVGATDPPAPRSASALPLIAPEATPIHPWKRPWRVRRQRKVVGTAYVQDCTSHPFDNPTHTSYHL